MTEVAAAPVVARGPDPKDVTQADQALLAMESYEVIDQESYELVAGEARDAAIALKGLEEKRMGITRHIDATKKAVMELFRPTQTKLERVVEIGKKKMLDYMAEKERVARAQQAAAEEAARKERERLEKEAAKLEKKGQVEQAEAKREIANSIPEHIAVSTNVGKVAGAAPTKRWVAEVSDAAAFLAYAAQQDAARVHVEINVMSLARTYGGKSITIPGIEFKQVANVRLG